MLDHRSNLTTAYLTKCVQGMLISHFLPLSCHLLSHNVGAIVTQMSLSAMQLEIQICIHWWRARLVYSCNLLLVVLCSLHDHHDLTMIMRCSLSLVTSLLTEVLLNEHCCGAKLCQLHMAACTRGMLGAGTRPQCRIPLFLRRC